VGEGKAVVRVTPSGGALTSAGGVKGCGGAGVGGAILLYIMIIIFW